MIQEWRSHIEIKALHFEAVAQFQKAQDDNNSGRYGDEVARLQIAKECSQKCNELCRRSRSSIARLVQDDARDLLKSVEADFATASKDNDLIYHQDVTAMSQLPVIKEADIVKAAIGPELVHPDRLVGSEAEPPIFGDLVAHGVRMAVGKWEACDLKVWREFNAPPIICAEIYEDRRSNWIKDEILDLQRALDSQVTM